MAAIDSYIAARDAFLSSVGAPAGPWPGYDEVALRDHRGMAWTAVETSGSRNLVLVYAESPEDLVPGGEYWAESLREHAKGLGLWSDGTTALTRGYNYDENRRSFQRVFAEADRLDVPELADDPLISYL